MRTFTRKPWLVKTDRLFYGLFPAFIGIGLIAAAWGLQGTAGVPAVAIWLWGTMGILLIGFGGWLYKRAPVPTRISIDETSVRIEYDRMTPVIIPRSAVTNVNIGMVRTQSSNNHITYRENGIVKHAILLSGYRDDEGKRYSGRALVKELRSILLS